MHVHATPSLNFLPRNSEALRVVDEAVDCSMQSRVDNESAYTFAVASRLARTLHVNHKVSVSMFARQSLTHAQKFPTRESDLDSIEVSLACSEHQAHRLEHMPVMNQPAREMFTPIRKSLHTHVYKSFKHPYRDTYLQCLTEQEEGIVYSESFEIATDLAPFSSCICIWKTFRAENICDQTRALGGVTPPPPRAEAIASKLSMPSSGGNPRTPPESKLISRVAHSRVQMEGGYPPYPPALSCSVEVFDLFLAPIFSLL